MHVHGFTFYRRCRFLLGIPSGPLPSTPPPDFGDSCSLHDATSGDRVMRPGSNEWVECGCECWCAMTSLNVQYFPVYIKDVNLSRCILGIYASEQTMCSVSVQYFIPYFFWSQRAFFHGHVGYASNGHIPRVLPNGYIGLPVSSFSKPGYFSRRFCVVSGPNCAMAECTLVLFSYLVLCVL